MTQPTFVPIAEADQVRPARHLHVPRSWTASRPAELKVPSAPRGRTVGTPGPDSGFALRLARRLEHDLRLREGESGHDVLLGAALVAAKRAALFGRAPSIYDVRFALNLWGFLDEDAAPELVERVLQACEKAGAEVLMAPGQRFSRVHPRCAGMRPRTGRASLMPRASHRLHATRAGEHVRFDQRDEFGNLVRPAGWPL